MEQGTRVRNVAEADDETSITLVNDQSANTARKLLPKYLRQIKTNWLNGPMNRLRENGI